MDDIYVVENGGCSLAAAGGWSSVGPGTRPFFFCLSVFAALRRIWIPVL